MFFLAILVVVSAFAYRFGEQKSRRPFDHLEEQVAQLQAEKAESVLKAEELSAALEDARGQIAALETRYTNEVRDDTVKGLLARINEKLDAGVKPDRLAFVIGAAASPRDCDAQPSSKRFIVQTPFYEGPAGSVTFGAGAFTVTGTGQPAKDSRGNSEAWFDPAQPVTIRFAHISGQTQEVVGTLPLQKSIVVGDSEFRFSVTKGPRSFVLVAGDRCRYP